MSGRRIIKITSFLLAAALMLGAFSFILCANERRDRVFINGFYKEPENSLDVVLIGSSELYTGFNSPLAWKEYGFTSYSLSISGMRGNLYKSALKTALDRQDPKLIVFELNGFLYGDSDFENEAEVRKWIDNFPWNKRKLETIKELVPEEERYSYYFPLFKYHLNIFNPQLVGGTLKNTLKLAKEEYSRTKCFSATAKRHTSKKLTAEKRRLEGKSKECFTELLDYCESLGLENVLFVYSPHKTKIAHPEIFEYFGDTIKSHGYDFVNLNNSYKDIGLDITSDFYNIQHLNIFGAQKYTRFLGKLIIDKYDVVSNHGPEITAEWEDSYDYMEKVIKQAEKETLENTGKLFYETTDLD